MKNPHHSIIKDLNEKKDFEVKSEALEGSTSSGHQFRVYIYYKLCQKIIRLDLKMEVQFYPITVDMY